MIALAVNHQVFYRSGMEVDYLQSKNNNNNNILYFMFISKAFIRHFEIIQSKKAPLKVGAFFIK